MTDAVSLPRAELIWPTVPGNHPDEPALDVLAAVLGGLPKENRLFRTLMYDRQLAAQVAASHPTHLLSGTFEVELYAQPGQKLDELVQIAHAEIERLKKEGPTAAEVRKAQNERESELVMGMQSVTRKASSLNEYMDRLGDPLALPDRDREGLRRHAGGREAGGQRATSGRISSSSTSCPVRRPSRAPSQPSTARSRRPLVSPPVVGIRDDFDRSIMPDLGPTPRYAPPSFERRKLSNGLELRIVERHDLPIVTFDLVVKSGETLDAQGQGGAGLDRRRACSTRERNRATPFRSPASWPRSARRSAASGELESSTVSLTTLTRHLNQALDLYADVILNPSFPEKELERLKIQRLAQLKARADDAEQTAEAIFPAVDLWARIIPTAAPTWGQRPRSSRSPATMRSPFASRSWCRPTPRWWSSATCSPTRSQRRSKRGSEPGPPARPHDSRTLSIAGSSAVRRRRST